MRQYDWGTCETMSSEYSDVAALKRVLLEEGFWELKALTEWRFHAFRQQQAQKTLPSKNRWGSGILVQKAWTALLSCRTMFESTL